MLARHAIGVRERERERVNEMNGVEHGLLIATNAVA